MSRAFYFENHNNLKIINSNGQVLVGQLELDEGSYIIWGKLSVGVNVENGYPEPAYPYTSGVASLVLGEADDIAYVSVKPEVAQNHGNVSLMCAASINRKRRARLYFKNLYLLPIYCHDIKIIALQTDAIIEREVGVDRNEAPEDKEEKLRDAIMKAKFITQQTFSGFIEKD